MASSQNQRYQERLAARQRGAATHKISTTGFSIKPIAPPAAPPAQAQRPPAPAPPPPPPVVQQPAQAATEALVPRRSGRSTVAKNASPKPVPAVSKVLKEPEPAAALEPEPEPPRRSARSHASPQTVSSPALRSSAPSSLRKEATTASAARRVSGPQQSTPIVVSSSQASSEIETPTYVSTRSASSARSAAVASVTPVPRGKRTRQPSPDKFLTTPEIQALRNGSNGTEEVMVAQASPGNRIKKRKIVVEEPEPELEEEIPALRPKRKQKKAVVEEPEPEPEPEEEEIPTPRPQRKQKKEGKRPPPARITQEEEEEAAEVERRAVAATAAALEAEEGPEIEDEEEEEEDQYNDEDEEQGYEDQEADIEEEEQEDAESEAAPSPPPRSRKKPKSAKGRPRSNAQAPPAADDDDAPAQPRRPRQAGVPITVYRLAAPQGQSLPPGSQRSGINAVDSISQIFMETVDKFYSKLERSSEKRAVEAFKEELGLRLMELSDALETNITLNARVRQAQRRKAELQMKLLQVKKERQEVAVKMDDVRIAHEVASKASSNRQNIATTFEDITGVIERGRARQQSYDPEDVDPGMDGLEALAMKVANVVTGGGEDGTGLLARVAEFNRFLERAEERLRLSSNRMGAKG